MALRLIRSTSMGSPAGGGNLSVSSDGKVLTINNVMRFRHVVNRFADAVPIPGGLGEDSAENQAIVYDIGGVKIEFSLEFVLNYSSDNDLYNDYSDIDKFLSTIDTMEFLVLEVDEYGWTGLNSRNVVLKGFELERVGGERNIVRGRIQLLSGKPVG